MIKGMLPPAVIILCVFGLEAARGQNADGAPPKNDGPASSTGWVPWERFTVAASDANMIDPVAAATGDGRLVAVSRHRRKDGDRIEVTVGDSNGELWSLPAVIDEAEPGWELLPTGMGRLASGRLILCAVSRKVDSGQVVPTADKPSGVLRYRAGGFRIETVPHVYHSDDDGGTWREGNVDAAGSSSALTPCGRPIETDGTLILPAHGPANDAEMDGELSSLGLLRSEDNGETWRYVATIVRADVQETVSYGPADIARLPDGTLSAFIEVNDRGTGPGFSPRIARSTSMDGGTTWTAPVNTLVGPRPSTVVLENGALLCGTSADDGVHVAISYDGGIRWSSMLYVRDVIHYRSGTRGGIWLTEPTGDSIFGVCHWMHSEDDHRTEVQGFFMRRRDEKWPPSWTDRPYRPSDLPESLGRWQPAEAQIVRPKAPEANGGLVYQSLTPTPDGHWLGLGMGTEDAVQNGKIEAYTDHGDVFVHLMRAPQISGPWESIALVPYKQQLPNLWMGMVRLKSGRILVFSVDSNEGGVNVRTDPIPGAPRGQHWVKRTFIGALMEFRNGVSISDDDGKTWTVHYPIGEDVRINGQKPACVFFDRGHVLELDDGTLVRTCQAWLTQDHQKRLLVSSIIVRSSDGGETWSDASLIAMADEDEGFVWREPHVTILPDGRWLVVIRSESFKWMGKKAEDIFLSAYVSWSSDQGHTWTKPHPLALGVEAEAKVLPDGTLMIGARKYNQGYYWLSDDGGETFFLQEAVYEGPTLAPGRSDIVGTPRPILIDGSTVLTVSDAPGQQVMSSGPIHVRYLRRRGGN